MLLDHGAAVDARSVDESTPLHKCAAWQASPAVVGLLAAKGADINARVRPLHGPRPGPSCGQLRVAGWLTEACCLGKQSHRAFQ